MRNKIKEALKSLLLEFNSLSTETSQLYWEEDSELMVGYKVFVDQDGEKIAAPDGEYISDNNIIKVEEGTVTEIKAKEEPAQEEPTEEPAEEKVEEIALEEAEEIITEEITSDPEPETEEVDRVADLEARIIALENQIIDLNAKVTELATVPAAEPVIEEFEKVTRVKSTGDNKMDKYIKMFGSR